MLDPLRTIFRPARKQSIFRAEQAGAWAVPRVFGGLVVCFAVTGLLSSERLVEMADRQEYGPQRDRWMAAAEVVHELATGMGLDRPASAVESALGRADDSAEVVLGDLAPGGHSGDESGPEEAGQPTTPSSSTAPSTTEVRSVTPTVASTTGISTTEPTTTEPPTTERRTTEPPTTPPTPSILGDVSVDDPLRIWIGGDSLGEYVGSEMLYRVAEPELTDVELDFAISTGLARPDYFDWPARLSEVMQREGRPQVVIFMVGGNDDQDMLVGGERVVVGTEEWRGAYRRRAATMMDISAYSDVQMLWISLPPMRDEGREAIARDINRALRAEADLRPWVEVVDIVEMFTGPGGGYEQFLDEPGGDTTRKARANDGIHITRAASRWVADMTWALVVERWRFDHRISPPTTPAAPSSETTTTRSVSGDQED